MDNSMEQRFVDRLLQTLATMSEYAAAAPITTPLSDVSDTAVAINSPISH